MDHASLARQTLDGLEERLQRLRLTIFGNVSQGDEIRPSGTQRVGSRIHSLEKALEAFEAQSSSIRDLLRLNKSREAHDSQTRHNEKTNHAVGTGEERIAIAVILAHSEQYRAVASGLRTIQEIPVADTSVLVDVIAQLPRLELAARRAEQQQIEMAQLREHSAHVLQRWHEVGVLGQNDAMGEWEDRLLEAERKVRQAQVKRARDTETT